MKKITQEEYYKQLNVLPALTMDINKLRNINYFPEDADEGFMMSEDAGDYSFDSFAKIGDEYYFVGSLKPSEELLQLYYETH